MGGRTRTGVLTLSACPPPTEVLVRQLPEADKFQNTQFS